MKRHPIMRYLRYPSGSGLRFFGYSEGLTPSSHSSHGTRYPLGSDLRFLGRSEGLTLGSNGTEHAGQRVAPAVK